jgi:hypothetical protein
MEQFPYSLILVIANQGYSAEIMDAAKSAGAAGGTVVHAVGTEWNHAEKFFGLTLQPEKELILILTGQPLKQKITEAVSEQNGPGTDAGALVFSVPVGRVAGLQENEPH